MNEIMGMCLFFFFFFFLCILVYVTYSSTFRFMVEFRDYIDISMIYTAEKKEIIRKI